MNKSKVVIVNLNLASGKRFFIHLELAIASAMPASNEWNISDKYQDIYDG